MKRQGPGDPERVSEITKDMVKVAREKLAHAALDQNWAEVWQVVGILEYLLRVHGFTKV